MLHGHIPPLPHRSEIHLVGNLGIQLEVAEVGAAVRLSCARRQRRPKVALQRAWRARLARRGQFQRPPRRHVPPDARRCVHIRVRERMVGGVEDRGVRDGVLDERARKTARKGTAAGPATMFSAVYPCGGNSLFSWPLCGAVRRSRASFGSRGSSKNSAMPRRHSYPARRERGSLRRVSILGADVPVGIRNVVVTGCAARVDQLRAPARHDISTVARRAEAIAVNDGVLRADPPPYE